MSIFAKKSTNTQQFMTNDLQTLIDSAPYSTDPEKQRKIILATFLKFLEDNGSFKIRSTINEEDGDKFFFLYATDFNFERYLWVDFYADDVLVHAHLEDCMLDEVLYSSDGTQNCSFSIMEKLDKRGELKPVDYTDYL